MTDDPSQDLQAEFAKLTAGLACEVAIIRMLVEMLFAIELLKASEGKEQALQKLDQLWKTASDEFGLANGKYKSLPDVAAEALTDELDKIFQSIRKRIVIASQS